MENRRAEDVISHEVSRVRRFIADFFRVGLLMICIGIGLYWADEANVVIFQAAGVGLFLVGTTHLTRRIIFPRLDLQSIAISAIKERNYCALGVFSTVVAFTVAVMFLSMRVFR
jgi:hypothetical protein